MSVRICVTLLTVFVQECVKVSNAGPELNWIRTSTHHAETVVLIHAVGHDLTYWDRQIEALSASYNVVAFDLPGHGDQQ
ncbi:MAG: alpha/beta fold hydrolase [Janthinobacterium lividum]